MTTNTGTLKIGMVVDFSIVIPVEQELAYFYQKTPIPGDYELILTNNFKTGNDGRISMKDINEYIEEACKNYVSNSGIDKVLLSLDYTIDINNVDISLMH